MTRTATGAVAVLGYDKAIMNIVLGIILFSDLELKTYG